MAPQLGRKDFSQEPNAKGIVIQSRQQQSDLAKAKYYEQLAANSKPKYPVDMYLEKN